MTGLPIIGILGTALMGLAGWQIRRWYLAHRDAAQTVADQANERVRALNFIILGLLLRNPKAAEVKIPKRVLTKIPAHSFEAQAQPDDSLLVKIHRIEEP